MNKFKLIYTQSMAILSGIALAFLFATMFLSPLLLTDAEIKSFWLKVLGV